MKPWARPHSPSLIALASTSPTRNSQLARCQLAVAYDLSPELEGGNSSPAAALGLASHQLLEAASKGSFDLGTPGGDKIAIRAEWDRLIEAEVNSIQGKAFGPVPDRRQWSGYAMKMAAANRVAKLIVDRRRAVMSADATPNPTRGVKSEAWLEAFDGMLRGRIDLIRWYEGSVEILDYKSGVVLDTGDAESGSNLKPDYVRQLNLYAALYFGNFGVWPSKAVVESLVDGTHQVEIDPDEAASVADQAIERLQLFNRAIASATVLGSPSEESCRWCAHTGVCAGFQDNAEESWNLPGVSLRAEILEVNLSEPTLAKINILGGNVARGSIAVRNIPVETARALEESLGSTVSFAGLRRIPGGVDLMFTWSSRCWVWEE